MKYLYVSADLHLHDKNGQILDLSFAMDILGLLAPKGKDKISG
jgi:hypothetical protein